MNAFKDYYRRITESLPQRKYFTELFLLFLITSFIFSFIFVVFAYVTITEAKAARKEALDNFTYWREVAEKHPNSPDAFYEAGYYAAILRDKETALKYIEDAIRLDPDFKRATELKGKLDN